MTFAQLQQATIMARKATGMNGLGTQVKQGRLQVVNVTYAGKKTIVDPLSGWVSLEVAVDTLGAIAADGAFRQ